MSTDQDRHQRRSIRLKDYDYTSPGAYFVTLVTWRRENLFGKVVDGAMQLNTWGFLAENEWRRLGQRFESLIVDEFVVMPNHIHGILMVLENDRSESDAVGARQKDSSPSGKTSLASPLQNAIQNNAKGVSRGSIGAMIGAYKSTTARLINGLRRTSGARVWQRNYYEHIIRNEVEMARIQTYILANPAGWESDDENPLSK